MNNMAQMIFEKSTGGAKSKQRLLALYRILHDLTDDEHSLATGKIIRMLTEKGYPAERRTIQDDIRCLEDAGFDILIEKNGKNNQYHLGGRTFDTSELMMLIDAVSSSRFIPEDKSDELIAKLSSLSSSFSQQRLDPKIYTANRIKSDNGTVFITADIIARAINVGKKIRFQYYDYTPDKEKVLRHGGEFYTCSPYAMLWNDDRYYLISYSDKHQTLVPFRVDRMKTPEILDEEAVKDPDFDIAEFARKELKMFVGPEQKVVLECENELMQNIVDKFGVETPTERVSEEHFQAEVTVGISPTFFSWIFQFEGKVRIVSPEETAEKYRAMLETGLKKQE